MNALVLALEKRDDAGHQSSVKSDEDSKAQQQRGKEHVPASM
jgi:hypothetical protein